MKVFLTIVDFSQILRIEAEVFQILFALQQGFKYNRVMEQPRIDNQEVRPDLKTGKFPTPKQLVVLYALNPFKDGKNVTYKAAAIVLGISVHALSKRMRNFKSRCPVLSANYKAARYPKKRKRPAKIVYETGCSGCGCDIPANQQTCFRCWKKLDMKARPNHYAADNMYPANGVTSSTIGVDKWTDNDRKRFGFRRVR